MINEERTLELFGYTSDQLAPRSGKKIVAVCEGCGRYRVATKHDYKKLCRSCVNKGENSSRWKGGQVAKVCEVCGSAFYVDRCDVDKRRTCSNKCYGKWRSENMRGENSSSWKEKVVKVCEVCGEEFSVVPALYRQRFCSRECQGKWQSEAQSGENNPSWNGGQAAKVCEVCGEEFSVALYKTDSARFCSRECYGKWQSEAQTGENNHSFNKSPSLEARRRASATKQGISYDEWESFATNSPYCPKFNERCRESNREKYDRRCFLSGMPEEDNGQKLSVHHYDMNKAQGCDGHTWKLVPLCRKLHSTSHTPTWTARIVYLLEHVWNSGRNNVIS